MMFPASYCARPLQKLNELMGKILKQLMHRREEENTEKENRHEGGTEENDTILVRIQYSS